MTASPPGSLRISDWVILNCSFSRPDPPASVHWFRGRVPVQESPHHHLAGSFLFLPKVSPSDSGPWGCILTYRDGFNVSITYNLSILGNTSSLPSPLTTTPPCPPLDLWVPKPGLWQLGPTVNALGLTLLSILTSTLLCTLVLFRARPPPLVCLPSPGAPVLQPLCASPSPLQLWFLLLSQVWSPQGL